LQDLDDNSDKAMVAMMLVLPSLAYLIELANQADIEALHHARENVRREIAQQLHSLLLDTYLGNQSDDDYRPNARQIAQRSLKNACLAYLSLLDDETGITHIQQQYQLADNMTDQLSALHAMVACEGKQAQPLKHTMLADFYARWKHEALVVNQWLQVQATATQAGALDRVKALMEHEAFDFKNPNKARAVIMGFCSQNPINFHHHSGSGYQFLAEQVIAMNSLNPQMASRMVVPLSKWRKLTPAQGDKMKLALEHIMTSPNLSSDVFEMVSKALKV